MLPSGSETRERGEEREGKMGSGLGRREKGRREGKKGKRGRRRELVKSQPPQHPEFILHTCTNLNHVQVSTLQP
jgi:hypothetical protein